MKLLRDPNYLLTTTFNGSIKLYDIRMNRILIEYQHGNQSTMKPIKVDVDLNENFVYSITLDQRIGIWRLNDGKLIHSSQLFQSEIISTAIIDENLSYWICQPDYIQLYQPKLS